MMSGSLADTHTHVVTTQIIHLFTADMAVHNIFGISNARCFNTAMQTYTEKRSDKTALFSLMRNVKMHTILRKQMKSYTE